MRGLMEFIRHPFGTEPSLSASSPVAAPQSVPAAARCKVEFDANGKVLRIDVPQGRWAFNQKGQHRYFTQTAHSLLHATEILKKVEAIPELTYYTVDTPNGSLGRDIQGFYTEGPIKTENLVLEVERPQSGAIEFSHLKGFGDMMKNQTTVALLRKTGQYARLVLLMQCGHCGYESPVETQAGPLARQCYCCGLENSGQRGNVTVILDSGMVQI